MITRVLALTHLPCAVSCGYWTAFPVCPIDFFTKYDNHLTSSIVYNINNSCTVKSSRKVYETGDLFDHFKKDQSFMLPIHCLSWCSFKTRFLTYSRLLRNDGHLVVLVMSYARQEPDFIVRLIGRRTTIGVCRKVAGSEDETSIFVHIQEAWYMVPYV